MGVSRRPELLNRGPQSPSIGGNVVIDLTSDDEEEGLFSASAHPTKGKRSAARINQDHSNLPPILEAPQEFHQAGINRAPSPVQNGFGDPQQVWGDYFLDANFGEEAMAGAFALDQQFTVHPSPPRQPTQVVPQATQCSAAQLALHIPIVEEVTESRVECVDNLSSEHLTAYVLDKMEKGSFYPNVKDKQKQLKRKREVDEDQEAACKYGASDREIPIGLVGTRAFIAKILSLEFPLTAMNFIHATCTKTKYRLFSAYEILEKAERSYDKHNNAPYRRLKSPRKCQGYTPADVAAYLAAPPRTISGNVDHEKIAVYEELHFARRIKAKADVRREAKRAAEVEEEANVAKAEAEGTMSECECCCCDYPLNRMVHCDGDIMHWFCRGCAKQNAEVEVGKSKYELWCMSTVPCAAGFTADQRTHFLDAKMTAALERIEQESILRAAGIANLASCPFCPFAAEYPPIEDNSEFTCQAPDCERVSCRRCRLDSHTPKSCAEYAKDNGLSVRRQVEEAMSAAMIRKCNKCDTPFVKEEGCNKMTCTSNGCRNIQCYVCHKSCDYSHFNDQNRGGKVGNCPLFESAEKRHDEEVTRAEKEILDQVLAAHPQYTIDDLKIKMSEDVKRDDENRKALDPRARQLAMHQGAMDAMQQRAHAGQAQGFANITRGDNDVEIGAAYCNVRYRRGAAGRPVHLCPGADEPNRADYLAQLHRQLERARTNLNLQMPGGHHIRLAHLHGQHQAGRIPLQGDNNLVLGVHYFPAAAPAPHPVPDAPPDLMGRASEATETADPAPHQVQAFRALRDAYLQERVVPSPRPVPIQGQDGFNARINSPVEERRRVGRGRRAAQAEPEAGETHMQQVAARRRLPDAPTPAAAAQPANAYRLPAPYGDFR
ncbi:unnamed protein product [Diplocarpon coronariae]